MLLTKFEFNRDKCWYKDVCKLYRCAECTMSCPKYHQMYYLFNQSGIPQNLQYPKKLVPVKSDEPAFRRLNAIKNDIVNWVNSGNSLYICSPECGNGKTSWSIKIMSKYFDSIWNGNGFDCRGIFVNCSSLLVQAKSQINRPEKHWHEYIETIRNCDLVIWDDIGDVYLSSYDYSILIDLINSRISLGKSNIYTSNLGRDQLTVNIGKRLASRIYNGSEIVEFVGGDRRSSK